MRAYLVTTLLFLTFPFGTIWGSDKAKSRLKSLPARAQNQATPSPQRIKAIQRALSNAGYRGEWKNALRRYQKNHGWQTKIVPDSRALISLGLGPKYTDVLNPQTAWISLQPTSSVNP